LASVPRRRSFRQWLALSGAASPAILTAATTISAAAHPGYSHLHQTLSELGASGAPGAASMNVFGLMAAGALVSASSVPLPRAFGSGPLSKAAAAVLAAAGVCFVVAGLFPLTDGSRSGSSTVHNSAAMAGFAGLGLSPLLLALHARGHARVRAWFVPSLVTAVVVFGFASSLAGLTPLPGASQRAALVAFYTWLVAASVRAFRAAD
jgi:hypothetical membrane protein